MRHSRQVKPAAIAGTAAGAGSGAGVASASEVQALLVDIFALTGQKVEIGDPIVAAALIHSALLRRAGEEAAKAIKEAAQHTDQDLLRTIGWLAPWRGKAALGAILFVICFVASALGSLLFASNFH